MIDTRITTSRRALLGAFAAAPIILPQVSAASPKNAAVSPLRDPATGEPLVLTRSSGGRSLSRLRYHRAESFLLGLEGSATHHWTDQLYQAGIVLQLGLSSHLLDVGFDDAWCARHLGLHVAKSLAYANASGLDHSSTQLAQLAEILSPYGKWRHPDIRRLADECPFSRQEINQLARALLDSVRQITGHPRPKGWRNKLP